MHLLGKELPFPLGECMENNGNGVVGWMNSKEGLQKNWTEVTQGPSGQQGFGRNMHQIRKRKNSVRTRYPLEEGVYNYTVKMGETNSGHKREDWS